MTLRIIKHEDKYRIQSRSWKTLWFWRMYVHIDDNDVVTPIDYDTLDEAEFIRDWLQEAADAGKL